MSIEILHQHFDHAIGFGWIGAGVTHRASATVQILPHDHRHLPHTCRNVNIRMKIVYVERVKRNLVQHEPMNTRIILFSLAIFLHLDSTIDEQNAHVNEIEEEGGKKMISKFNAEYIYVKITYTHDLHIYYLPPQNIDIPYFPSAILFTCHSVRSFSLRSGQPVKSKYYYKKKQNSNSYLDSFWSDTAVSCSRGIFCSRACMASWADDFRIPASMSHTWNSNRTAFWTFYCHRWRGMVHACHGHPIISHRHMRTKFPVGQPLHVSISFAKIAHRSCDCGLVWLVWANGGSEGQQKIDKNILHFHLYLHNFTGIFAF